MNLLAIFSPAGMVHSVRVRARWDSSTTSSRAGSKALVNFSAMRSRLAMASA